MEEITEAATEEELGNRAGPPVMHPLTHGTHKQQAEGTANSGRRAGSSECLVLCQALGHSSNTATICRAKVQRGRTAMNAKRMLWGCTVRLWGTFL